MVSRMGINQSRNCISCNTHPLCCDLCGLEQPDDEPEWEQRAERYRAALRHIAEQLTSQELASKGGYEALECADFESAYDTVVLFSRKAATVDLGAREVNNLQSAMAAVQRYHDIAGKAERALHEIAHLPDDADLHEATLIALRALPLIEDKSEGAFHRSWCAWCGGTCECDEDDPDDLSDGLPHLNRNE